MALIDDFYLRFPEFDAATLVFFGFADNPDAGLFDDKFNCVAGSAPFKSKWERAYTTCELAEQYIPILEGVYPHYYGGGYEGAGVEIVLNLLGHLVTVETQAGAGNPKVEQSKSVGSVSVSYAAGYATTSERDAWFKTTRYGARYLILTANRGMGGRFV